MGTSTQFAMFRLVFCCNAKFNEGMVHETNRLLPEGVMFSTGVGVLLQV